MKTYEIFVQIMILQIMQRIDLSRWAGAEFKKAVDAAAPKEVDVPIPSLLSELKRSS